MAKIHLIILSMMTMLLVACGSNDTSRYVHEPMRAVYHWRTTYDPDSIELTFMQKHSVGRMYIHYFDVNLRDGEVIPEATLLFKQKPAEHLEVVPTIYITIDALREMKKQSENHELPATVTYDYAKRIVKRIIAMNTHNHITGVKEVQIDCDWTAKTQKVYFNFLSAMKEQLHEKDMALSVTVRLHQLEMDEPPADMGVLMLYNTGNLMSEKTHNSILDINDVKPYFKPGTHYDLPLDFAYPDFGWKVCYSGGKFLMLASSQSSVPDGCEVRHEQADYATIRQVKQLAESTLGNGRSYSTIIYHLDNQFLNQFSNEEMEHIFNTR